MTKKDIFCTAYSLDNKGYGKPIPFDDIPNHHQFIWLHFDFFAPETKTWLSKKSGLDEIICEALLATETRPRTMITPHGILTILRDIPTESQAELKNMISLRIWAEEKRIITVAKKELSTIMMLRKSLDQGTGPHTAGEFLDEISEDLTTNIASALNQIDEKISKLENITDSRLTHELRPKLSSLRREIIAIRRYLAPQRDALSRLAQIEKFSWLTELSRFHILETSDRTIRCVEDLDEARDRATVIHETISSRISEQVEQRMYILSMVAAIFLPLAFITGLLGINVGGIPGAQTQWAFALVSAILIILAICEYFIFKKKRWL